jgi:hypothetical protein
LMSNCATSASKSTNSAAFPRPALSPRPGDTTTMLSGRTGPWAIERLRTSRMGCQENDSRILGILAPSSGGSQCISDRSTHAIDQ